MIKVAAVLKAANVLLAAKPSPHPPGLWSDLTNADA